MTVQTRLDQAVVCLLLVMALDARHIHHHHHHHHLAQSERCSNTGEACADVTKCCSQSDVCLKSPYDPMNPSSEPSTMGRNGRCVYIQIDNPAGLIKSGEICTDSHDCRDRCCRELIGHRSRHYTCGKPYDVHASTCVAPALGNNIPGDV